MINAPNFVLFVSFVVKNSFTLGCCFAAFGPKSRHKPEEPDKKKAEPEGSAFC